MHNAVLIYPEFPNTFFLTYHILLSQECVYDDFKWNILHCDWENTMDCVKKTVKQNYDIICYYGTEENKIDGISKEYEHSDISLPVYQPRFIFIPYDFDIYKEVYENLNLNTNGLDGIITAKDINKYPDWKNEKICTILKKRGIPKNKLFTDTTKQGDFIKRKLGQFYPEREDYPVRIYYYGAPLTLFYLKRYPQYLPIKISDSAIHQDEQEYNKYFKTFIHIYRRKGVNIKCLEEKIKRDVFTAYVDAILEPQLLTPMFRKYNDLVPGGQFYTMTNVNDFSKAITLHCNPSIKEIYNDIYNLSTSFTNTIQDEAKSGNSICYKLGTMVKRFCRKVQSNLKLLGKNVDGDGCNFLSNGQSANIEKFDQVRGKQIKLLQDFRERTSDSLRNEDKYRVDNFNKIKKIAFGCKIFLLVYLFKNRLNSNFFENVSSINAYLLNDEKKFFGETYFLYKSVVSFLTWEYVLSLFNCSQKDVSDSVLSDSDNLCRWKPYVNSPFYLRYKKVESEVIEIIYSSNPKVKEDEIQYDEHDIKKFIAYTEYVVNQYVDNSIQSLDIAKMKTAYNYFSMILNKYHDKNKILFALFEKFAAYKVYRYNE